MDLTEQQITELNDAAYSNMQALTDSLWHLGGKPTQAVLDINPNAPRMKFFKLLPPGPAFPGACPNADLDGGYQGRDLIDLAAYMLACDRERAAKWVADVLRRAPPPSPTVPSNTAFRSAYNTRTTGRVPHGGPPFKPAA